MSITSPGPTSRIYFSQRLRLHYVDWGNAERAAAAAGARRPRPLPQLGLGGRGAAPRLAHHRARPARPRRQPVVAGRHLHDGRLRLRPGAAHPPAEARRRSRSSPIRSAATSRCATPGSIPRTWPSWSPSRGSGPSPEDDGRALRQGLPRAHARLDRRAARPLRPPAAPLRLHRGRLEAHAGGEQAPLARAGAPPHPARRQPERGRHLQLEVRQLRALLAALRHDRRPTSRSCGRASPARRCWSTARRAGPPTRTRTAARGISRTPRS